MRRLRVFGGLFLVVALVVVPVSVVGAAVDEDAEALWPTSLVPGLTNWADLNSVELGVRFITSEDALITGVRFHKGDLNTGTHFGTLWAETGPFWDKTGTLLATGEFINETEEGWQDLIFDDPVAIVPGQVYVASYWLPVGYYSAVNHYFTNQSITVGPITALQAVGADGNGVYAYSETSTFPEFSFLDSNYWVTPLWTAYCPDGWDLTHIDRAPTRKNGKTADNNGDNHVCVKEVSGRGNTGQGQDVKDTDAFFE
jgi:hypothetical protein